MFHPSTTFSSIHSFIPVSSRFLLVDSICHLYFSLITFFPFFFFKFSSNSIRSFFLENENERYSISFSHFNEFRYCVLTLLRSLVTYRLCCYIASYYIHSNSLSNRVLSLSFSPSSFHQTVPGGNEWSSSIERSATLASSLQLLKFTRES